MVFFSKAYCLDPADCPEPSCMLYSVLPLPHVIFYSPTHVDLVKNELWNLKGHQLEQPHFGSL